MIFQEKQSENHPSFRSKQPGGSTEGAVDNDYTE
jgi:hypothetical protein